MRSATKNSISHQKIQEIMQNAFGETVGLVDIKELTEGMFNSAYHVSLNNPELEVVLKVSPKSNGALLSYEKDLMQSEIAVYQLIQNQTHVPSPNILLSDFSGIIIPENYFIMEKLKGSPWNKISKTFSEDQKDHLKKELGRYNAQIHQVKGGFFGYPSYENSSCTGTWKSAFLRMVDEILMDANKHHIRFPWKQEEIKSLFHQNSHFLDEVPEPKLVHFDLWEGNLFIRRIKEEITIEALIDCERAFWGDPAADFVSNIAIFKDIRNEKAFLEGYQQETHQIIEFNESLLRRLAMYRIYLYLIMATEGKPRNYPIIRDFMTRKYVISLMRQDIRFLQSNN
jgi:fructosamine-3-kinase